MQKRLSIIALLLVVSFFSTVNIQAAQAEAENIDTDNLRRQSPNLDRLKREHLQAKTASLLLKTAVLHQSVTQEKKFTEAVRNGLLQTAENLPALALNVALQIGAPLAVQGIQHWWTQPSPQDKIQMKRIEYLKSLREKMNLIDENLLITEERIKNNPDDKNTEAVRVLLSKEKIALIERHNKIVLSYLKAEEQKAAKEINLLTKEE